MHDSLTTFCAEVSGVGTGCQRFHVLSVCSRPPGLTLTRAWSKVEWSVRSAMMSHWVSILIEQRVRPVASSTGRSPKAFFFLMELQQKQIANYTKNVWTSKNNIIPSYASHGAQQLNWLIVLSSPRTMTLLNNPQATSPATVAYFLSFGMALFSYTTGSPPPPLKCL